MTSDKRLLRQIRRTVLDELRHSAGFPLTTDELEARLRERHALCFEATDLTVALRKLTLIGAVVSARWPGKAGARWERPSYWVLPSSPWARSDTDRRG